MVKITNYELYTDRGEGWKLEDRFSVEQRHMAINMAKEIEQDKKIPVKIIREIFDIQDNTYMETIEYVSGLGNKDIKNLNKNISKNYPSLNFEEYSDDGNQKKTQTPQLSQSKALGKLIALVALCLVFANILVSLLTPVIEEFIPEEYSKKLLFIIFFFFFLLFAIPLVLKKVPWDAFFGHTFTQGKIDDRSFFTKANTIIRLYNLNDDYDEGVMPIHPEAPLEYKKYIVNFLSQIIGNMDTKISLNDNFSKLGIKLIVYGGCFELARYCGLSIAEANSLLYEAFSILDGEDTDLNDFYEAKRTYKDNKIAVYLTGVGAYLMAQIISDKPLDTAVLKLTFSKWYDLSQYHTSDIAPENENIDIMFTCIASLKIETKFYDDNYTQNQNDLSGINNDIRSILLALVEKFRGKNVIEKENITSVQFNKLNDAVQFIIESMSDFDSYQNSNDDKNFFLDIRGNILELDSNNEVNLSPYIDDIFEQSYNNEILIDEMVKDELPLGKYSVDYLGEKTLKNMQKSVPLYKLIY